MRSMLELKVGGTCKFRESRKVSKLKEHQEEMPQSSGRFISLYLLWELPDNIICGGSGDWKILVHAWS
jgi:hypothetical protein